MDLLRVCMSAWFSHKYKQQRDSHSLVVHELCKKYVYMFFYVFFISEACKKEREAAEASYFERIINAGIEWADQISQNLESSCNDR